MWNQGWVCLNLSYHTEMPSLGRKKQYVNLCIAQEAEVENSLQLLRAEQGPEGIAAAPVKWNLNYIFLFRYCVVFPILFYGILNNYTQWATQLVCRPRDFTNSCFLLFPSPNIIVLHEVTVPYATSKNFCDHPSSGQGWTGERTNPSLNVFLDSDQYPRMDAGEERTIKLSEALLCELGIIRS